MYWSKPFFFILIVLQVFACTTLGGETSNATAAAQDIFFDTKIFIEEKKALFSSTYQTLNMTVSINGEQEEKLITDPDWDDLLKPFVNANINRLAWKDDYSVREDKANGKLQTYYEANKESAKIRSLETMQFEGNPGVHYLRILTESSNFIYSSKEELIFDQGKATFSINREQQYFLLAPEVVSISAKGLRK